MHKVQNIQPDYSVITCNLVEKYKNFSSQMTSELKSLVMTSEFEQSAVHKVYSECRTAEKSIDEKRKLAKAPLTQQIEEIDSYYGQGLDVLRDIKWQIKPTAPEKPLTCAIETHFTFFMPIPKGTSKAKKLQMINRIILPSKKPDLDNLAYLITNALKGIVYQDDNQICVSHCYKYYGETPKTIIKIYPIHTA